MGRINFVRFGWKLYLFILVLLCSVICSKGLNYFSICIISNHFSSHFFTPSILYLFTICFVLSGINLRGSRFWLSFGNLWPLSARSISNQNRFDFRISRVISLNQDYFPIDQVIIQGTFFESYPFDWHYFNYKIVFLHRYHFHNHHLRQQLFY